LKTVVVDASVAIKWFIPEIHAIEATHLLHKNLKLLAPDLIFAEVGSILWKKCRLKELTLNIASAILDDFKKLPFDIYESEVLLDAAWQIATTHQCTIYDSLYVALAQTERSLLVTADSALYNTLKKTHLEKVLLWVEDIKVS
jgi:predicted nucleic acid-binding protein